MMFINNFIITFGTYRTIDKGEKFTQLRLHRKWQGFFMMATYLSRKVMKNKSILE